MTDRTSSSISIAAEPGAVLDVIADFESYPEWAEQVKTVTVLSEDGDGWADQVQFTLDAGAIKDTYSLGYVWDVQRNGTGVVSWSLVEATVLKAMNGSYTLAARGKDARTVTYRLAVDVLHVLAGHPSVSLARVERLQRRDAELPRPLRPSARARGRGLL